MTRRRADPGSRGRYRRRDVLGTVGALAGGSLAGCSSADAGTEDNGTRTLPPETGDTDTSTPTPETTAAMDVDFDDDSTEPLAVRSEVGETPQVVDPLDRDGRVLELATSVGRTAAVRSSVAVTAPVELAVSVTKRRDTGGDDGIAVRLVDDRNGAVVGLVESSDGDVRHTVSSGDGSGTETASVGGIDVGTWERVTVTVDEDGTQSARGDQRATISGDDWTDRPLRADLAILGRSDEGAVTAWFDDLTVTSL